MPLLLGLWTWFMSGSRQSLPPSPHRGPTYTRGMMRGWRMKFLLRSPSNSGGELGAKIQPLFFFFFCFFRATPAAYGDSQARGPIGAAAASLYQSHSHVISEPHLQPTHQLTAIPEL